MMLSIMQLASLCISCFSLGLSVAMLFSRRNKK